LVSQTLMGRSRPYAWPWHGQFAPRKTALLVVHDGLIAPPPAETKALIVSLAGLAGEAGIVVGDLPDRQGTPIACGLPADFMMVRPHHGGFTGTDLDSILRRRGITDLIFAGFPFEIGADCTMRQANDLGYECLALVDCCTGVASDTLAGAISSIQMSGGIFGAVGRATDLLAALPPSAP
jgi:hypothetical protein